MDSLLSNDLCLEGLYMHVKIMEWGSECFFIVQGCLTWCCTCVHWPAACWVVDWYICILSHPVLQHSHI